MATHGSSEDHSEGQTSQPKRAEAAPPEESRLLAALVDNIPGCIAMILKKGTREIVASNGLAREVGAVLGETCFSHCASRDDPCPFCLAPKLWATGEEQEIEVEYRGRWYEKIWVSLSDDLYVHYIFDLTERKQAEIELRESTDRLLLALDVGDAGIWEWDLDADEVHFDASFHALLGYEPRELPTSLQEWMSYHHPADVPIWTAKAEAYLRGESPGYESEHRIRSKAGLWNWVFTRGKIVQRDSAGVPKRFVGVAMNTTERTQTEQLLKDEVARRRLLVEQSRDGIVVLDQNGKVHEANMAFARMLGYSAEEVARLHVWDWEAHYSKEQTLEMLRTVDERGDHIETRHRRKDGTWFDVEISTSGITSGGEKFIFCVCRDVSERRRNEEALAHSRHLMRFIVEHTPSSVAVFDRDLKYIYVSQRYLQDYDVKEPEVFGRHHYEVFPDLPQKWRDVHQKALAGEISSAEDDPYLREDGHMDWTRWECRPWYEADGSIGGIVVYAEITTERKRAEELLRTTTRRLELALHAAHAGTWDWDVVSGHIEWSAELFELFGLDQRTTVASFESWRCALHPEDIDMAEGRINEALAQRTTLDTDYRVVLPSGETRWINAQGEGLYDNEGRPARMIGICWDITARKMAEESLRLAQFSVDNSADFTMWLASDGRFVNVSESFCTRLGYSRDELVAMSIFDIDVAVVPAEAWPERWREIRERGPLTFEREYRTKNGETFPVEIRSIVIEHEGREYDCGIARDITERKAAEEALRQAEERLHQSQKMEAVGQLAGGIAHDFNNLLTAILGYSDLILLDGSSTVDEVRPDLEEIKRAGERARVLTQQILAFSRRQALRPQVVFLDQVLRGIEPLLRRSIGEDIDLQITESPGLAPVEVDPHQFEQVVVNLLLNARDAMPSGGRLTIETGTVDLDEEFCRTHAGALPGSYAMLRVSDTGVGMDAATKERIFEPFFTTKAVGAGTGLGLATVYGVVKQSGGSIFVTSEPGRGSSFALYLPRAAQPEVPEETPISPPASARGHETVMVVEDEEALRRLIERVLGAAGYQTLIFTSAPEALATLEQEEPVVDMLLTDVMLPGPIQGHDLARSVLALRPHLPVLYISGYARDALVHAGRLDEGVNLLEKPFTPKSLTDMVREVLDAH